MGNGCTKTQIVYKANLNFNLAGKYLAILVEKSMLTALPNIGGNIEYKLTSHGHDFLRRLSNVEADLG